MCLNAAGLKAHLSKSHGGWEADEIAQVMQGMPATEAETAQGDTQAGPSLWEKVDSLPDDPESPERETRKRSKKSNKASVRMSDALGKFRTKLAGKLPAIYAGIIKDKAGIEGTVSNEWMDILGELWSAYFELLGFDISAEPLQFKIGGKWLTLIFPILMLPLTFFIMSDKHKKEPGPEETPVAAAEPAGSSEVDDADFEE